MVAKRVLVTEATAFLFIILFIWLDEVADMPHLFMGAEATPVNWRESLFESLIIGIVGAGIIRYTTIVFQRIKKLEGILPICAACKKIKDEEGRWHPIESFIHERSEAEFSHGICPECAEKLYPGTGKSDHGKE